MLTKEETKKITSLLKQIALFVDFEQNTSLTFDRDVNTLLETFLDLENEITALKLLINGLNAMLLRPIEKEIDFEVYIRQDYWKDDPDRILFLIEKRKEFVDANLLKLNNILEKKLILNNDVNSKDDVLSPDLNTLQNRTKILLLQELGVLDFLKKKVPFKNSTNLAKLIAELISGKNDDINSVYESIRTDLSYVTHKNQSKSPYTKPQIKKVNSTLASFSLPLIK
ncbi:MAG: hypothetical protein CMD28_04245 [Flavobacteriales bacterium]|nr:hypothetical protein [Flavobacteriales bacterium]